MTNDHPPRLSLRNLTKTYPGVVAVDNVSIDLAPGEVHGLVGENGAGKSTLIKILAGAVRADRGEIAVNGAPLALESVRDAAHHGMAFIHQELNLVPYFDAAENIFLGHPYPRTRWGTLDRARLRRDAAALLARFGVRVPVRTPVRQLSPGQQTLISIARAFAGTTHGEPPAIMVMDEPTAALTDGEIEQLFAAIRTLRSHDVTVIYVSHRLEEVFALADRITVMRNGRVVTTEPAIELDRPRLISLMTGRERRVLDAETPAPATQRGQRAPVLTVEDLSGPGVSGLSFRVGTGEVLGVAGLVGAGRTELLRLLYGAAQPSAGRVLLHGQPVRFASPGAALAGGIALLPEERRSQGLLLHRSLVENTTLSQLAHFARGGWLLSQRRERRAARHLHGALRVKADSPQQPVAQLSGGNQQKVLFARMLAAREAGAPLHLLLLDEPTRGVDVGAKDEIYAIIRQQAEQGVGVIVVSSELPELMALTDRILVLHEGRQVALVETASTPQETILNYCYGATNRSDD